MDDDIRVGNAVKFVVKHQFKGPQLGFVIGKCKDGHWLVENTDPEVITKTACIDPVRGDQIFALHKK